MEGTDRERFQALVAKAPRRKGFVNLASILNASMSPALIAGVAKEDYEAHMEASGVDTVLTAPASGNAVAAFYAMNLAPGGTLVTAKEGTPCSWTLRGDSGYDGVCLAATLPSATHPGKTKTICVLGEHLRGRRVVLVDDVAGTGAALVALARMVTSCSAQVHSAFVFVEKEGAGAREALADLGIPLRSAARVSLE